MTDFEEEFNRDLNEWYDIMEESHHSEDPVSEHNKIVMETIMWGIGTELIRRYRAQKAALKLVDQVWARSNLHPDVNFMGDDEHEAWEKVQEALTEKEDEAG